MLRGTHSVNLDTKGRFVLPAKHRSTFVDDTQRFLVCTISITLPCLSLYPLPEWQRIEKSLMALPTANVKAQRIKRLLVGNAHELELDSQGRLVLPAILRKHGQLKKKLALVGQLNKFEIWSETVWENQMLEDLNLLTTEDLVTEEVLSNLTL